jgi:hypothetical protein
LPPLADTQQWVRAALTDAAPAALVRLLRGGGEPLERLAIHQRHYQASLVGALLQKFPAAVWYAGSDFIAQAARRFVTKHPPRAACIAEYGEAFPEFLAAIPGAERAPGLSELAMLDWHLGHVSVAVEAPAVGLDALTACAPEALCDLVLDTQPGLRHLAAAFPVDALMRIHLQGADEAFETALQDVGLEIRGARGAFGFQRLDPGAFAFRTAVAAGRTVGTAAEVALAHDEHFDPGSALTAFVADGLVIGVRAHPTQETLDDRP